MSKALALAVGLPVLMGACSDNMGTSTSAMNLVNSDSTPYSLAAVELGWPVDYVKSVFAPGDCKPSGNGGVECNRYSFSDTERVSAFGRVISSTTLYFDEGDRLVHIKARLNGPFIRTEEIESSWRMFGACLTGDKVTQLSTFSENARFARNQLVQSKIDVSGDSFLCFDRDQYRIFSGWWSDGKDGGSTTIDMFYPPEYIGGYVMALLNAKDEYDSKSKEIEGKYK